VVLFDCAFLDELFPMPSVMFSRTLCDLSSFTSKDAQRFSIEPPPSYPSSSRERPWCESDRRDLPSIEERLNSGSTWGSVNWWKVQLLNR